VPRLRSLLCAITVAAAVSPVDAQRAAIAWERYRYPLGRDTVDAELGRLTLPEDHAAANGPKITLALVRLSGTANRTRPPTIYLDGGPGSSGITTARLPHFAQLFKTLREVGDVILVDQRGIGMSRPNLACPSRTSPPADLFATEEKFRRYLREGARACATRQRAAGVRLEHYTTEASADDIAAAIRALGARQANLFGFSYGTHLGLAIIRRHASLVHRAVLAGVEGPDHSENGRASRMFSYGGSHFTHGRTQTSERSLPTSWQPLGRCWSSWSVSQQG
jgi:pimeloyl-ACP methyl ester carboxylesterase